MYLRCFSWHYLVASNSLSNLRKKLAAEVGQSLCEVLRVPYGTQQQEVQTGTKHQYKNCSCQELRQPISSSFFFWGCMSLIFALFSFCFTCMFQMQLPKTSVFRFQILRRNHLIGSSLTRCVFCPIILNSSSLRNIPKTGHKFGRYLSSYLL